MSPNEATCVHGSGSFPRVSGDEPAYYYGLPASAVFSPRERG